MAAPAVALDAIGKVGDVASGVVQKFQENPWDFIAQLLIEIGAILLLAGIALGFVGYYLKAYSVKAKGDAAQGISTVESVFGNVSFNSAQQPYLAVTGPNVANDIANLGNDAWRGLQNTAGQAWADLKGIATAIDDIPKALVQLVSQGPGIAINGFLGLVTEALSDIFILVFPYAIIFGGSMLAAGAAMTIARWAWDSYMLPEARIWIDRTLGVPLRDWTRRLFQNPPVSAMTAVPAPPVVPEPPERPAPPLPAPPAPAPEAILPAPTPPDASASIPGAPIQADLSDKQGETLVAVPTEVQQENLGDKLQEAKDRLRAALRRRDQGPPEPDYVGWAYSRIRATA